MFIIKKISANDTLPIRHRVLWPNKPIDFCILPNDNEGIHYGGFIDNKLISVASIFIDKDRARLRKFATIVDYQGNGYGSKIIDNIISDLKNLSLNYFWCDARVSAEGFYNKFKMKKKGNTFFKSDVKYIVMERDFISSP